MATFGLHLYYSSARMNSFSFPPLWIKILLNMTLSVVYTSWAAAQTIPVPTQTGTVVTDPNGNNKAEPGDKIRYKVTIQNTHVSAPANGVQLNAVPDAKTTVVVGSFRSSPLALADSYACTGNVGLNVPAANGLKANDFDDNIPGLNVTAFSAASAQGGTVSVSANGSFTYTPPNGFTGNDSFTYTISDSDNQTNTGTVKIRVQ